MAAGTATAGARVVPAGVPVARVAPVAQGGPNGQGSYGKSGWGGRDRFRGTFEEWHREAHASGADHGTPTAPADPTTAPTSPPPPATPA